MDWLYHVDLVVVDEPTVVTLLDVAVTVPAGSYLVVVTDSGPVTVYRYDTEEEAREDFDDMDTDYSIKAWT